MRIVKRILPVISVLSFLVSCEYHFDLKDMPSGPVLAVECVPGLGLQGKTVATIRLAEPVTGYGDYGYIDMSDVKPEFLINGKKAELVLDGQPSDGKSVVYCSDAVPAPGDRLVFRASVDGVRPVSAETVIPESYPDFSVDMEKRDDFLVIKVNIGDSSAGNDYYAVRLVRKTVYMDSSGQSESEEYSAFFLPEDVGLVDLKNHEAMSLGDGFDSFYVFAEDTDGQTAFSAVCHYAVDEIYTPPLSGGEEIGSRSFYKVYCYRLSPEYYYYFRSRYQVNNNELGTLGWAPGNFAYSNIKGGLGVFGGAVCKETGWLPNI